MRFLTAVLILALIVVAERLLQRVKRRKYLRDLDACAASDPARFHKMATRRGGPSPAIVPEFVRRFRDPAYPVAARGVLMGLMAARDLEATALKRDDPLAPAAWVTALRGRHDVNQLHAGPFLRVRSEIGEAEMKSLWERALASADPWALPAELDVRIPRS